MLRKRRSSRGRVAASVRPAIFEALEPQRVQSAGVVVEQLEQRTLLAADTLGSEFWLAFQQNFDSTNPQLQLFISGPTATTGTVAVPGLEFATPFAVTPGQVTAVELPAAAYVSTNDGVQNRGIHVTAAEEISVYGLNRVPFTTDAFGGLPVDILSNDYIAMTHVSRGNDRTASQIAVVATQDATVVTITPRVTIGARTAGVSYQVTLNAGQVYQLANLTTGGDLTGTSITSDKVVAVFGGNSGAQVPVGQNYVDHIVEQMTPVQTWGRNFVTVPLAQRTGGDMFRIVAAEDATEVRINNALVATLSRGQFHETLLTASSVINATKPVLLGQFAQGRTFDNTTGDPFLALVPSIEQLLTGYTIATPTSGFTTHWINVWTPSQAASSVRVDGMPVAASLFTPIGDSGFVGARISIQAGTHTVTSDSPIGAMVYGFNQDDSYGYTGGSSLVAIGEIASVTIVPIGETRYVEQPIDVTATVLDVNGNPVFGARVDFNVTGANPAAGFAFTRFNGQATFQYIGTAAGTDTVTANAAGRTGTETVTLTPAPDLTPTTPAAPPLAQAGEAFLVTFLVQNTGGGATNTPWTDRIVLSADTVLGNADDRLLASLPSVAQLPGGGSYQQQAVSLTLPADLAIGDYRLFAVADSDGQQFESDETNNAVSVPVRIARPDLQVMAVSPPSGNQLGQSVDLNWVVGNAGEAVALHPNTVDRVYLSRDGLFSADDLLLLSRPRGSAPLEHGESYNGSGTATLPLDGSFGPGTYQIVVITDATGLQPESDEANNQQASTPFSLVLPPLPDLVVASIGLPAEALSGQSMTVTWTLRNDGTALASGDWLDQVLLSTDSVIDNDQLFGTFAFSGTIAPGQSITRTQSISLPLNLSGPRWAIVRTDVGNSVNEFQNEGNNAGVSSAPVQVQLAPIPNLIVEAVTAPATAFSGQQVAVEWTVRNIGTGPTNSAAWADRVYLSTNATLDAGDIVLGDIANASYLNAGEAYHSTLAATLPEGINGDFFFIVQTDAGNRVVELNAENDNVRAGSRTAVALTPPPDLRVTSVVAPGQAFSGQTLSVGWTVTNSGPGSTRRSAWYDEVFVSFNDDQLDAADRSLGTFRRNGELPSGGSYTVAEFAVTLPVGVSGPAFFIVRTDRSNEVFEFSFEGNNVTARETPTQVNLTPPPDLEVTSVDASADARAGRGLTVSYTVTNNGATATPNASWNDAVYLSVDATFSPTTDLLLGVRGRSGVLDAGESESRSYTFTLPTSLAAGPYYAFVVADQGNAVFEVNDTNNVVGDLGPVAVTLDPPDLVVTTFGVTSGGGTASAAAGGALSLSYTVGNVGDGATYGAGWSDSLILSADATLGNADDVTLASYARSGVLADGQSYPRTGEPVVLPFTTEPGDYSLFLVTDAGKAVFEADREGNNWAGPVALTVVRPTPDLRLTAVSATVSIASGTSLAVTWSVQNDGEARTNTTTWNDEVYLSADATLDAGDVFLGATQRSGTLDPGGSYTRTASFPVGIDVSGTFFVIVRTDAANMVLEGPAGEGNNTRASASTTAVTLSPTADLRVTAVDAPAEAFSGRLATITWTVTNAGAAAAAGTWSDAVYLSPDQVFDRTTDLYLGFVDHAGGLPAGGSYSATGTFDLPQGFAGRYYAFVLTDAGNRVYERAAETNNAGQDPQSTNVTLTPPADLVVGSMTIPVNGVPGQDATISFRVDNNGQNPAIGRWFDSVYLSTDGTYGVDDAFFGRIEHVGNVPAGGSYTSMLTAPLPGLLPGDYQVIVRSDIRNNIPESDETNNVGGSLTSVTLDAEELTLGVPHAGTLAQGRAVYYKVTVPAGETLAIEFDSAGASGFTELYASLGEIPTRSQADFSAITPFQQDQRILISDAIAGTYYIAAFGIDVPTAAFQIAAKSIPFEASAVSPDTISKSSTTIEVTGARFSDQVRAFLKSPTGLEFEATRVMVQDSTRLFATFTVGSSAEVGDYRLVLRASTPVLRAPVYFTDPIAEDTVVLESVLDDLVRVVAAPMADYQVDLLVPSASRPGQAFSATLSVSNPGPSDLPTPLLSIQSSSQVLFQGLELSARSGAFLLLATPSNGPVDVLRPGETRQYSLRISGDVAGRLHLDGGVVTTNAAFDAIAHFRAVGIYESNPIWQDVLASLADQAGTTWGSYQAFLIGIAEEMALRTGHAVSTERELLSYEASRLSWTATQSTAIPLSSTSGPTSADPFAGSLEVSDDPATIRQAIDQRIVTPELIAQARSMLLNVADYFDGFPLFWDDGATHLRRFVNGTGGTITYGVGSAMSDTVRNATGVQFSHAQANARALKIIQAEIERRIRDGARSIADIDLASIFAASGRDRLQGPNLYRKGAGISIWPIPGKSFGLQVAFGDMSGPHAGIVTEIRISENGPEDCPNSISYEAKIIYDWTEIYSFHDDNGKSGLDSAAYYLEEIAHVARPFTAIVKIDELLKGVVSLDPESCDDDPPPPNQPSDPEDVNIVQSVDPNDILGPTGFGPERWVPASQPLAYSIRFENDPDLATAPAQVVTIRQTLDPNLDARTFRLGDFGFGITFVDVPDNRAFYSQRLDLRSTIGLFVDAAAGVDVEAGEVFWSFTAIDPLTGELPVDPFRGLLPVNGLNGEGEGFVLYTVRPKVTAVTGDVVNAAATIVFDVNPPIDTPPVFNTLDAGLPASAVATLPPTTAGMSFQVAWGGSDDPNASGIAYYDVYVSEEGGPFEVWLSATPLTEATYVGRRGRAYRFFTVARDNAGNIEPAPAMADAVITFGISGDFNEDGVIDAIDIDLLMAAIFADEPVERFDLTGDGNLDALDTDRMIRQILHTEYGDANLDGQVSIGDLTLLAENFNAAGGWAAGDFDGDGQVSLGDLVLLASHLGQLTPVPGDTSGDRFVDAADIDLLNLIIRAGGADPQHDLNGDSAVDQSDVDTLVQDILDTDYGDANLDGQVGISDLAVLAQNIDQPGGWAMGDFNGDWQVSLGDLILLAGRFGTGAGLTAPVAQLLGLDADEEDTTEAEQAAVSHITDILASLAGE